MASVKELNLAQEKLKADLKSKTEELEKKLADLETRNTELKKVVNWRFLQLVGRNLGLMTSISN